MDYFNEQLRFFSDLLLGRNYLWKTTLEQYFPLKFVFDQINNENLSLEIRSVFCDLALSLYIDHEPLNQIIVPNLCRVFRPKSMKQSLLNRAATSIVDKVKQLDEQNFTRLLENIVNMIRNEKKNISEKLKSSCENIQDGKIEGIRVDNYLNNILLANIIKMLSKMINFDLLTLLNKTNLFSQIVHDCIHILEFEKDSPVLSYAVSKLRDENYKKNISSVEKKKNKVFGFMTCVVGNMKGLASQVVGTVASTVFGSQKKTTEKTQSTTDEEANDTMFLNNPIMKGLILIKHQLDQLTYDPTLMENQNEILIKEEICDLLNFMIDLRQNFLLSNTICWFDDLMEKFKKNLDEDKDEEKNKEKLNDLIDEDTYTVLPPVQKTGIESIDEKFKVDLETGLFGDLANLANITNVVGLISGKKKKKGVEIKNKKFNNYTGEPDMLDLDQLFKEKKDDKDNIPIEVLPSFLMTFLLTKDTTLEDKILRVIMRSFSQKEELLKNLEKLEIIFNNEDVEVYKNLESWISEFRLLTERSEVKLLI